MSEIIPDATSPDLEIQTASEEVSTEALDAGEVEAAILSSAPIAIDDTIPYVSLLVVDETPANSAAIEIAIENAPSGDHISNVEVVRTNAEVVEIHAYSADHVIHGTAGADYMWSHSGGNIMNAGDGVDTLVTSGSDTLYGGDGADTFIFDMHSFTGPSVLADLEWHDTLIVFSAHGMDVLMASSLPHLAILHEETRFEFDGGTIKFDGHIMALVH